MWAPTYPVPPSQQSALKSFLCFTWAIFVVRSRPHARTFRCSTEPTRRRTGVSLTRMGRVRMRSASQRPIVRRPGRQVRSRRPQRRSASRPLDGLRRIRSSPSASRACCSHRRWWSIKSGNFNIAVPTARNMRLRGTHQYDGKPCVVRLPSRSMPAPPGMLPPRAHRWSTCASCRPSLSRWTASSRSFSRHFATPIDHKRVCPINRLAMRYRKRKRFLVPRQRLRRIRRAARGPSRGSSTPRRAH